MRHLRHWLGIAILMVVSLLAAEGILRLLAAHMVSVSRILEPPGTTPRLPDPVLGERGNPRWYDHDPWGFRNERKAAESDSEDVVTIGDSQTYGVGVTREQAWPALLSALGGRKVYNMALPGWGPAQGYLVLDRALQFHPKLLIYAFYFGNDFFDVFDRVARRPELREVVSVRLLDSARSLESQSPIADRVRFLFAQGDTVPRTQESPSTALRNYLSEHSRLYRLQQATRQALSTPVPEPVLLSRNMDDVLAHMSARQRTFVSPYRDAEWKTLFTAPYRNIVLNDQDPRIRAGVIATEVLLGRMNQQVHQRNAAFLVLLIPTKETVFSRRFRSGEAGSSMDSLLNNERRLRTELEDWLSRHQVDYLDLLPVLQASQGQPYFEDADGHPAPAGHAAIAEAVLKKLQPLEHDGDR